MKKILIVLIACFCILASGCSYGGAGLVQNSDGSVVEYYYMPFPEAKLEEYGVNTTSVLLSIKNYLEIDNPLIIGDGLFAELINNYQKNVSENNEYSLEEKTKLISGVSYKADLLTGNNEKYTGIRYRFNFDNATCYSIFKNINEHIKEDRVIEEVNNFFTITTKVVKDPIFDKVSTDTITLGKKCLNVVDQLMIKNVGQALWNEIKQDAEYKKYSSKFEYTYVVPTARIHTNAQSTQMGEDGYYYHTWQVDLNNLNEDGESIIKIEYWTISANRWVWYSLALVLAGGIITGTIIYSNKKDKKEKSSISF